MTQPQPDDRHGLLTPLHAALRRSLLETAIAVARANLSVPAELAAARRAASACFGLLRDFANLEAQALLPVVARLAPDISARLASERAELEREATAVERLLPRIGAAPDADGARSMAAEVRRQLQELFAAHVQHMDHEERELNPILRANLTNEDRNEITRHMASAIPPERLPAWIA